MQAIYKIELFRSEFMIFLLKIIIGVLVGVLLGHKEIEKIIDQFKK